MDKEGEIEMNIKIRNLDFNYDKDDVIVDVNVRFESSEPDGTYLNGNIKITKDEYLGTSNMQGVIDIVKVYLKGKFNPVV